MYSEDRHFHMLMNIVRSGYTTLKNVISDLAQSERALVTLCQTVWCRSPLQTGTFHFLTHSQVNVIKNRIQIQIQEFIVPNEYYIHIGGKYNKLVHDREKKQRERNGRDLALVVP